MNTLSPRSIKVRVYTLYERRKVYARPHLIGETHVARGGRLELQLYSTRSGQVQATRTVRAIGREEVVFDTRDSGSTGQKITYAAYPGETPVFTSLVQVTGWSTYQGSIMKAPLPGDVSRVRYLHDNSESWMERSSTSFFRPAILSPSGGAESEHWEPGSQDNKTYTTYPASFNMPGATSPVNAPDSSQKTSWEETPIFESVSSDATA